MRTVVKDEVLRSVEYMKNSGYRATAIKVELEATICRDWGEGQCTQYMLERLRGLGLAGGISSYNPKGALKYLRVYNDGSVDTECTFTLSLQNPENILYLPKIINIFKDMCSEAGSRFEVAGAGMHMALLNNAECRYPVSMTRPDIIRFSNFRKSLTLAIPALYFLATHNEISRSLSCRRPEINCSEVNHGSGKFNAITYKGGALEYRVFDTCYDKPEAIFDNVVVIANSLRYWTDEYTNPNLEKVTKQISFGNDSSRKLERFYGTIKHLDLLEAGLLLLKPSYYTLEDLKAERNFKLERDSFVDRENQIKADAERGYAEYAERKRWSVETNRMYYLADKFSSVVPKKGKRTEVLAQFVKEAREHANQQLKKELLPKNAYIQHQLEVATRSFVGGYNLTA